CRAELAGEIRCDERAARLVATSDQPHREPSARPLEIEVQTERPDRPAAAARLLRIEVAEEDPRARLRSRDAEAAGGGELVVERFCWNHCRIGGRRRGTLDDAPHFACGLACKVRRAVAKVLLYDQ